MIVHIGRVSAALMLLLSVAPSASAQNDTRLRSLAALDPFMLACRFVTECIAPEVCNETDFEATITVGAQHDSFSFGHQARMSSVAGDLDLALFSNADDVLSAPLTFAGLKGGAFHVIARTPNTVAVYTVTQEEGPLAITYLGTCEEVVS